MNKYREALLELLAVVGKHPDAMFEGAPLNAAFCKAADVFKDEPIQVLTNAIEGEIFL